MPTQHHTARAGILLLAIIAIISACQSTHTAPASPTGPYIVILGIAQDAGYPQTACRRDCCRAAWSNPELRRLVSCLAIVDPTSNQRWIIDATPDLREQVQRLDAITRHETATNRTELTGIFLTHAHIGHYTGLMQLGREVIGDAAIPVYAMPRMQAFLTDNGPWNLLITSGNIALRPLAADQPVILNDRLTITPMLVPHRDEFSETVAFRIDGPSRSILFIPDIDKWELWDRSIEDEIAKVDVAYLDGTFYANGEIPGRDMSQIPHPFIEESLRRFAPLPASHRARIRFIHLNHTNPALNPASDAAHHVRDAGFNIAHEGETVSLGHD